MNEQRIWHATLSGFAWDILPHWFGRFWPRLGLILQDGRYISGVPIIGSLLGLFGAIAGFAGGLIERDGQAYTANFGVLAMLVVLGMLSGQAGVWAVVGFVLADGVGLFRPDGSAMSLGLAGGLTISWFFLFQLVAGIPHAARQLVDIPGRLGLLNGLISALFAGAGVELWTRLSMVALRPLFTWQGDEVPGELTEFIKPDNEWVIGGFTFHNLAWLAFAAGVVRWVITPLLTAYVAPVPFRSNGAQSVPPPQRSFGITALARAACVTALVAGVLSTVIGLLAYFLTVFVAVFLRGAASANRWMARWDGLMFRIPAAIRLILSFAVCFYLSKVLVLFLRDTLEWRTMTVAGFSMAVVFTVSLLFWPQVASAKAAPPLPPGLRSLMANAGQGVPRAAVLFLAFGASAAYAHHCSFLPGCECLTDEGALAGLAASATSLALWLLPVPQGGPGGSAEGRPTSAAAPSEGILLAQLSDKLVHLRASADAAESGKIVLEFFDLMHQAKDANELLKLAGAVGVEVGPQTAFGQSVGGAAAMLVDPTLDFLAEQSPMIGNPYVKGIIGSMAKYSIYYATGDLSGAATNLGFQALEIATELKALDVESQSRVADRLGQAMIESDAMRAGKLSSEVVLDAIRTSRSIEVELDPGLFNTKQQQASQQVNIINDVLELAVKQSRGEEIQPDIDRLSREYGTFKSELSGYENLTDYYNDFAARVAATLGVRGW